MEGVLSGVPPTVTFTLLSPTFDALLSFLPISPLFFIFDVLHGLRRPGCRIFA